MRLLVDHKTIVLSTSEHAPIPHPACWRCLIVPGQFIAFGTAPPVNISQAKAIIAIDTFIPGTRTGILAPCLAGGSVGNQRSHSSFAGAKSSSLAMISVALTAWAKLVPAPSKIAEILVTSRRRKGSTLVNGNNFRLQRAPGVQSHQGCHIPCGREGILCRRCQAVGHSPRSRKRVLNYLFQRFHTRAAGGL